MLRRCFDIDIRFGSPLYPIFLQLFTPISLLLRPPTSGDITGFLLLVNVFDSIAQSNLLELVTVENTILISLVFFDILWYPVHVYRVMVAVVYRKSIQLYPNPCSYGSLRYRLLKLHAVKQNQTLVILATFVKEQGQFKQKPADH